MIVSEVYRRKLPVAVLKAVSQNLGHDDIMTTLTSYWKVSQEEQGDLIREAFAGSVDSWDNVFKLGLLI